MEQTTSYCCCALPGQIDRDLRRVEDKADKNTEAISAQQIQITRNEERIACLKGSFDEIKTCVPDAYCKGEIDCKLAAKADRCAFEKHLINPHAHEELFDRKVDKQDGFGLISDDCLAQICQNKDGLVLLEQYIRELQEQNACLKEELANKVNVDKELQWYDAVLENDFTGTLKYAKTSGGLVFVKGYIRCATAPTGGMSVFVLPTGFRPAINSALLFIQGGTGWATYGGISEDGVGGLSNPVPSGFGTTANVAIDTCFPTILA